MVFRYMLRNRTNTTGTSSNGVTTGGESSTGPGTYGHDGIIEGTTVSNIVSPDIALPSFSETTNTTNSIINCNKNLFQQTDGNNRNQIDEDDINSVASSSYTTNDQSVGQQTYEIPQQFHRVIHHPNENKKNHHPRDNSIRLNTTISADPSSSLDSVAITNTAHTTTGSSSSIDGGGSSSYCSTSSDDMMLFQSGCKLEAIPVSSLLPEDSYIIDRVSFDLQNCDEYDDNASNSTLDRNSIIDTITTAAPICTNQNGTGINIDDSSNVDNRISESLESNFTCTTAMNKYNQEKTEIEKSYNNERSNAHETKMRLHVSTGADVKRPTSTMKLSGRSLLEDESESTVGFNVSSSCDSILLSSMTSIHINGDDDNNNTYQNEMTADDAIKPVNEELGHHHQRPEKEIQQQQQDQPQEQVECPDFALGDHVYQWCSFAGVPRVYQHHGIVLDVYYCTIENEWILKIVDFSSWDLQQEQQLQNQQGEQSDQLNNTNSNFGEASNVPDDFSVMTDVSTMSTTTTITTNRRYNGKSVRKKSFIRSNCKAGGCIRIYESVVNDNDAGRWHKVRYNAGFWSQQIGRSGTCTSSECDPPGIVRARAQYIISHPYMIPSYSAVRSNCECVAVWCKTGTWCTLQAISWLHGVVFSQAKQAATIAGVATAATVTVPASGMWGWLGYTTTVSLVSTQPLLLPAIATYGVITTVGPTLWLLHAKKHWKALTERLNTSFWEDAVNHPDIFVECITHWAIASNSTASVGNETTSNYNKTNDTVVNHSASVSIPTIPMQMSMPLNSESQSMDYHAPVSPLKDEYTL